MGKTTGADDNANGNLRSSELDRFAKIRNWHHLVWKIPLHLPSVGRGSQGSEDPALSFSKCNLNVDGRPSLVLSGGGKLKC